MTDPTNAAPLTVAEAGVTAEAETESEPEAEATTTTTTTTTTDAEEKNSRTNNKNENNKKKKKKNHQGNQEDFSCSSFDPLDDIGFLFEGNQATQTQTFTWDVVAVSTPASSPVKEAEAETTLTESQETQQQSTQHQEQQQPSTPPSNGRRHRTRTIQVVLESNDSEPGAVISGHYLWPAAELLCRYLCTSTTRHAQDVRDNSQCVASILELGAGCGLVSLMSLQLWQNTLQCLAISDHDPGVCERARMNYETTLESKLDASVSEDQFLNTINTLGSIPVGFETLEWTTSCSKNKELQTIKEFLQEHTPDQSEYADLILGSDLIYSYDVVEPLLTTAAAFMAPINNDNDGHKPEQPNDDDSKISKNNNKIKVSRFLLSQSFAYDEQTETLIDRICETLNLQRTILWQGDNENGNDNNNEEPSPSGTKQHRIQEFTRKAGAV